MPTVTLTEYDTLRLPDGATLEVHWDGEGRERHAYMGATLRARAWPTGHYTRLVPWSDYIDADDLMEIIAEDCAQGRAVSEERAR